MKKLLWFIPYILTLVFGFYNIVYADTCIALARHGDPELPQNEANALERNCNQNNNCQAWWEYDARTREFDIQSIGPGTCPAASKPNNPDSYTISITIQGLDYEISGTWAEEWWLPTGELSPEGDVYVYLKRDARYRMPRTNIPTPVQNMVDANSHLFLQWADICGWVLNNASGLSGAECP